VAWALLPGRGYNPLTDVFFRTWLERIWRFALTWHLAKGGKRPSDIQLINQLARRHTRSEQGYNRLIEIPGQKSRAECISRPDPQNEVGAMQSANDEPGLNQ